MGLKFSTTSGTAGPLDVVETAKCRGQKYGCANSWAWSLQITAAIKSNGGLERPRTAIGLLYEYPWRADSAKRVRLAVTGWMAQVLGRTEFCEVQVLSQVLSMILLYVGRSIDM